MLSNCKVVKSVGKINLCLLKVHNASLLVNFLEEKLGYGWVVINVWIVDFWCGLWIFEFPFWLCADIIEPFISCIMIEETTHTEQPLSSSSLLLLLLPSPSIINASSRRATASSSFRFISFSLCSLIEVDDCSNANRSVFSCCCN